MDVKSLVEHIGEGLEVLKLYLFRRIEETKVLETQFADDAPLYSTSRASFETSSKGFVSEVADRGWTVSVSKTKGMIVGRSLKVIGGTL